MSTKANNNESLYISRVRVEKLFSIFNYEFPLKDNQRDISKFLILYGENGSGKTTILNLIFSLLSNMQREGHKTFLARTPFESLEIEFNDGTRVSARKESRNKLLGNYSIEIGKKGKEKSNHFLRCNDDLRIRPSEEIDLLFEQLSLIQSNYLYMTDSRAILNSYANRNVSYSKHNMWASYASDYEDYSKNFFRSFHKGSDFLYSEDNEHIKSHLKLTPTLNHASKIILRKVLSASSTGMENANSVYVNIARQLAKHKQSQDSMDHQQHQHLLKKIESIDERINEFYKYGFSVGFPAKEFKDILEQSSPTNKSILANILNPFMESTEANLDALQDIKDLIQKFTKTINSFFYRKQITYDKERGITIVQENGDVLDPEHLSSGEKQLLLILCNTIIAKEFNTIFFLDEPELSLNIKWQRKLSEALSEIREASPVQYIMASHSFEVLSKYEKNIIKL